jgi:diketogulonate reductase-like aldo/keto reductase
VGNALRAAFDKGLKREEIFVTTKLWGSDFEDPEAALLKSLKKLQLEYVDLFIIHYPSGYWNGKVPLHILWPKLEALVDKKLISSLGVANFNLQLVADMLTYTRIRPAVNYIELSPLNP